MSSLSIGSEGYWEEYYKSMGLTQHTESFDWYLPFEDFLPFLLSLYDFSPSPITTGQGKIEEFEDISEENNQNLNKLKQLKNSNDNHNVLLLGIGLSNAIPVLYKAGFKSITAIDISPTLIQAITKKYIEDYPGITLLALDVRDLSLAFKENTFSIIIDKGCLDTLFCLTSSGRDAPIIEDPEKDKSINIFDNPSTNISSSGYEIAVIQAVKEIYQVLTPGGVFFNLTHGPPIAREHFLTPFHWIVDRYTLPVELGDGLTIFLMTKLKKTENKVVRQDEKYKVVKKERKSNNLLISSNNLTTSNLKGKILVSTNELDWVESLIKEYDEERASSKNNNNS